jgi:hypothetical protein
MTKKVIPQEDAFGLFATQLCIGTFLIIAGLLVFMMSSGMRQNRGQSYSTPESVCMIDGRPVDCRTYAPIHTSSTSSEADARTGVLIFSGLLFVGGVIAFLSVQTSKDELKRRMIDYANKRARQEGTAPDLSFLFYFDSQRQNGSDAAEEKIARQAYARMLEWEKEGGAKAFSASRPAKPVVSGAKIVCPNCETVNDPDSRYCKKCACSLSA